MSPAAGSGLSCFSLYSPDVKDHLTKTEWNRLKKLKREKVGKRQKEQKERNKKTAKNRQPEGRKKNQSKNERGKIFHTDCEEK